MEAKVFNQFKARCACQASPVLSGTDEAPFSSFF